MDKKSLGQIAYEAVPEGADVTYAALPEKSQHFYEETGWASYQVGRADMLSEVLALFVKCSANVSGDAMVWDDTTPIGRTLSAYVRLSQDFEVLREKEAARNTKETT